MANTRKALEDRRKSVNLSLCREARAALALRPGEASRWVDRLILAEVRREGARARKARAPHHLQGVAESMPLGAEGSREGAQGVV